MIKAILFPYGGEAIVISIENNIQSFMQVIEGKIEEIEIDKNYSLFISRSYDPSYEDYKLQEEYGIFGNILVIKKDNGKAISIGNHEANLVIKNIREILISNKKVAR